MKRKGLIKILGGVGLIIVLVALLMSGCAAPAPAPAPAPEPEHEIVRFDIMTCPMGTDCFAMGMASAQTLKKYHPWLRATAQETPGYVYNVEAVETNAALWHTTMVLSSPAVFELAAHQIEPFRVKAIGFKRVMNDLGYIFGLCTFDSDIKTVDDLVGKKVAIGYKAQIDWGVIPRFLLEIGCGLEGKADIEEIGITECPHALLDGTADAVMAVGAGQGLEWMPNPTFTELLASGRDLHYISFPEEAFDKVYEETGLRFYSTTIPAGTFPGQTEDYTPFSDPQFFLVKDVFPEELIYEFIKTHLEHPDSVGNYLEALKSWTPEVAASVLTQKTAHPGSIRAFEEFGITIPE